MMWIAFLWDTNSIPTHNFNNSQSVDISLKRHNNDKFHKVKLAVVSRLYTLMMPWSLETSSSEKLGALSHKSVILILYRARCLRDHIIGMLTATLSSVKGSILGRSKDLFWNVMPCRLVNSYWTFLKSRRAFGFLRTWLISHQPWISSTTPMRTSNIAENTLFSNLLVPYIYSMLFTDMSFSLKHPQVCCHNTHALAEAEYFCETAMNFPTTYGAFLD